MSKLLCIDSAISFQKGSRVKLFIKGYFRLSVLLLLLFGGSAVKAQHIFREKLSLCNATPFVMETDSTSAKIADSTLIRIVKQSFDSRITGIIQGKLLLQILVDQRGRSCLLSYENNTNLPNHLMKLEETINRELTWNEVPQVTCVVVRVTITKDDTTIKRLGINQKKGWIELPY